MCKTCQGNGEIVTDWDRYLKPLPGDVGDEAVAECPDCGGTGEADSETVHLTPDPGKPKSCTRPISRSA